MNPPDGYSYSILGDECHIEHTRTGMACLNLFLGIWLSGWTVGCGFLIYSYLTGDRMEGGGPIPLWIVLAFVTPWFAVGFFFLYSLFARKTFRLTRDALQVDTRLLGLSWSVTVPRDAIIQVKQVKDGGEGEDSFPSWGLQLISVDAGNLPLQVNFGRNTRSRSLLARLPYDHSAWLGKIIAQWAGVEVELCPKPGTEAADQGERPISKAKSSTPTQSGVRCSSSAQTPVPQLTHVRSSTPCSTLNNQHCCESDEGSTITIELGDRSDDVFIAIVQSLLLIPGLMIAWPDHRGLADGDWFEYVGLLFACMVVGVTTFCVARCVIPPRPVVLRFCKHRLSYDSGRPGVKYLLDRFGDDWKGFYRHAWSRRRLWTIHRRDVRPSTAQVLTRPGKIVVKVNDRCYDVTPLVPVELEKTVVARISAWLEAEQSHAREPAAGPVANSPSSPPDR